MQLKMLQIIYLSSGVLVNIFCVSIFVCPAFSAAGKGLLFDLPESSCRDVSFYLAFFFSIGKSLSFQMSAIFIKLANLHMLEKSCFVIELKALVNLKFWVYTCLQMYLPKSYLKKDLK